MGRKFSILVAFCVVLFGAILAGYWDMLDSQKLREVRDQASSSVGRLTGGNDKGDAVPPKAASSEPAASGETPATKTEAGAPTAPENRTADKGDASSAATARSPEADKREAPVTPSFDVLRVEPDGSAVLAGRAAPNARIRLMDGATAIASTQASPEGDFAVVLDDRLSAGDHQIRIEADKGDGVRAISEQTAIVSVPKPGEGGELLAMVETPNQPSRIINLPTSKPPAQTAAAPTTAGSEKPAGPGEPPTTPSAGSTPTVSEPQQVVASRDDGKPAGASASPNPATSNPSAPPSPFAVEAVEIENGTIYVAGRAPGTSPVRVYLDNNFVGEDKARANDRFLVTAKAPLTVGDHEIRADMIGGDGAVTSRVEVPFAKPEGDTMSAVASNERPAGDGDETAPHVGETASPQAAGASGTSTSGMAASDMPHATAQASDSAGTNPQPQTGDASPPRTDASRQPETTKQAAVGGAQQSAQGDAAPAPSASVSPAEPADAVAPNGIAAPSPSEAESANVPSEAGQVQPPEVQANNQIATIRQPPLEGVHTRVLIRRGDTLWRISRETYGLGRRYTVIYLANGDQIRNPNRIYPGQLFRLPKDESKAID